MKLSVPAIVLSLCAVFATTSPVPVPEDFIPQPPPAGFDPSMIHLEEISYAGSGCKAGTVAITGNDPWTIVTLSFDSYIASIGPGIPFVERYKNCNINFKLHHPAGYSYTIYKTDYTGHVILESGVSATQESKYWFAGSPQPPPPYPSSHWAGPLDTGYHFTDTIQQGNAIWSPCGAPTTLNVNTQISLNNDANRTASGLITTEVIDHKATSQTIYSIQWRSCP